MKIRMDEILNGCQVYDDENHVNLKYIDFIH